MGSKHSRLSHSSDDKRRSDAASLHGNQPQDDGISEAARAEFTVDDIRSPENTRRAQKLRSSDHDRFCKYRNYFKNHHMSLAREVGRKTSKSKAELLQWVEDAVGPLESGDKFTKDEILEIAMVSAALSEYSEAALAKMYDRGELDLLPNIPLHTHNLRMPGKQQACRDSSDAANKDKLEAAHYIGLEVMLRLNERLPVEQRMGEELREILNHPSNLRLMLATSNQVLHKKVDAMIINATDASKPTSKPQPKISAREYDRLVQIAKHAQDEGFQDAMIAANGHHLYVSLRQQFNRLDVGDRPKLWDVAKDKRELHNPPQSRYRSPSPVRLQRAPPSPEKKKDPVSRMAQVSESTTRTPSSPISSEKQHRNPFSRMAAKIFHSHNKKKHAAAARSTSSTALRSREASNPTATKAPAHGPRVEPLAKAKRHAGTKKKSKQNNRADKGKPRPRVAAKKAVKKPVLHPSLSDDDLSSDSDYVDANSDEIDFGDENDENDENVDNNKNEDHILHIGPRGGKYYINASGKKVYVK